MARGLIDRALRMGEARQFKEYESRVDSINQVEPEMELLDDAELRAEADALRERARDAEWMRPIYDALGVSVGVIQESDDPAKRREAYACDVVYGTNSEFGFDYLRDNMASSLENTVQRGHEFAIVDEVDNILIDEARTPLIISGAPEQAADTYYTFARLAKQLDGAEAKAKLKSLGETRDTSEVDYDYEYDEKHKTVAPTEKGVGKAEQFLGVDNLYVSEHGTLVNHLIQALKAESLYKRDKDYA